MHEMILNRQVVQDDFQGVEEVHALEPNQNVIVPLQLFLENAESLLNRPGKTGVHLQPADTLEALVPYLPKLAVVAIEFPVFTDGRGYSLARLLRDQHHYAGQVRAVGDVFQDQLHYLSRCGFNAFVLRPGESATEALQGFGVFSDAYQASADIPEPLFRRRLG
jgi:uncharacterized protein (DUF934 family)